MSDRPDLKKLSSEKLKISFKAHGAVTGDPEIINPIH
jgi:hypothetical protein